VSLGSASDLAFMLKDAGVPVLYNGASSYGILDRSDALQGTDGAMMQVRTTTLLIATDAFTNVRTDGRIVVDKRPYKITAFDLQDDGALTQLQLVEAS
jgi:hypothetical protein